MNKNLFKFLQLRPRTKQNKSKIKRYTKENRNLLKVFQLSSLLQKCRDTLRERKKNLLEVLQLSSLLQQKCSDTMQKKKKKNLLKVL
mmetsp:Transcript_17743/g.41298  ORF Transcript_17743/g.41298 Transcript_17743/m.41298 type:complete len:87 (-) Transcript_17743:2-262(-)